MELLQERVNTMYNNVMFFVINLIECPTNKKLWICEIDEVQAILAGTGKIYFTLCKHEKKTQYGYQIKNCICAGNIQNWGYFWIQKP